MKNKRVRFDDRFYFTIAGAVAIYYLGELIDNGWEWLKKQIFE